MKKVFGATSSLVPPRPSVPPTPDWSSSLSDHFAGLPALWKQALKMNNGKATTTWSVLAELHKFHLACAEQLTFDRPIPLYMLWYCFLMCRIQYGEEVPYQLADGKVFIIPKPGGSGPDFMRFISLLDSTGKFLFGYWLSYIQTVAVGFLTVWRFDTRACRAGWFVSEQFWDMVKAFDTLNRPQLFHDIQVTAGWVLIALRSLYNRA